MKAAQPAFSVVRQMATRSGTASVDSYSSTGERSNGATDMNLYTADLMVTDRMHDRDRTFEANRLAALAREPRDGVHETSWRERIGRAAALFRVLRRGTASDRPTRLTPQRAARWATRIIWRCPVASSARRSWDARRSSRRWPGPSTAPPPAPRSTSWWRARPASANRAWSPRRPPWPRPVGCASHGGCADVGHGGVRTARSSRPSGRSCERSSRTCSRPSSAGRVTTGAAGPDAGARWWVGRAPD